MNHTRALAVLLTLFAPAAVAQTGAVDFDGAMKAAPTLADLLDASRAPRLPREPRKTRPAPQTPSDPFSATPAPAAAVSFHGTSLPATAFSSDVRIPDSLVAAIDATRSRLRLALYELNLPGVTDAVVRARQRGVDVELVYDQSHAVPSGKPVGSQPSAAAIPSPQFTQLVNAGIPTRILRGSGQYGIMHNKFAVFDDELVETGSFNWSVPADQANFENALFRDDSSLASLYESYFEYMWSYAQPVGANASQVDAQAPAQFAPPPSDPSASVPYNGETLPRVVFSPNGGTEALLVDAIGRAQKSVDVAMYSFYSPSIESAIAAAKNRGVAVRFVGDVSQARNSQPVADLVSGGVNVRLSFGRGGKGILHHKFMLLDGQLLETGSFNYSENAEKNNFENAFFSADAADVAAYQAQFEAVWAQAHVPAAGEVVGGTSGKMP